MNQIKDRITKDRRSLRLLECSGLEMKNKLFNLIGRNGVWMGKWIAILAIGFTLSIFGRQEASAFRYITEDSNDDEGYRDYDGENPVQSTIAPTLTPAVSEFQFNLVQNTCAYTGSPVTPAVSVGGVDSNGQAVTLQENVDYTVQYEDNVNYGVGRVIVQGIGSYSGYHILKFGILPEKVSGVKVKSPFYMENTVTWKKAAGADGYYIYRKQAGQKEYSFVANVTDANFQVFHDKHKSLKKNKKYNYKIVAYVSDPYYDEEVDGSFYQKPQEKAYSFWYSYRTGYKNSSSYYSAYDNGYYNWYSYSAVKGECVSAFVSAKYGTGSGKVTAGISSKRYPIYTGDANIDYMAYLTNKKIIKKGMSDDKRVQVIYRWMVKNCTFTKDVKNSSKLKKMKCYIKYNRASMKKKAQAYENKVMKQIYQGKALCIGTDWHDCDRAEIALAYRKGSCSFLTPMFNILCNQAGVEAYIVDGFYVNRDGSKDYHNWSFARLGRKYYWYDVPVACNKNVMNVWYKKGTKFWKTCHKWSNRGTKVYAGAVFQK